MRLLLPLYAGFLIASAAHAQTPERVLTTTGPEAARRSVQIDVPRLAAAAAARQAVVLALPSGDVVTRPERVERRGAGSFTWFGAVDGGGRATLTVEGGRVAGRVQTAGGVTVIEPRAGGPVAYRPAPEADDAGDALAPPPSESGARRGGGDALFPDELHVALFYTPSVVDSLGAGLPAFLQGTVDVLTDVLANSAVPSRARLVASGVVDYAESGTMSDDLYAFADPFDGQMDDVHARRDAASADFAALLTEIGANAATGCGIAFLMAYPDVSFESAAFSVTKRSCEFGLVFSHEIGHNLGLHHDRYVTTGSGADPFSHGFTNIDPLVPGVAPGFRTVLAYNTRCQDAGGTCDRIPYFSNPEFLWNGLPMGVAGSEDNAQTARSTTRVAADFRAPALLRSAPGTTAGAFRRPVCPDGPAAACTLADAATPFATDAFRVTRAGRHYVRTAAAFAGVSLLYAGPFDAADPLRNLVGYAEPDAGAPAARRLLLAADLAAGVLYTAVTTGLGAGDGGAFTADVFGPTDGSVVVSGADPPRAAAGFTLGAGASPTRGAVAVRLTLAEAQAVAVDVFDVLGRRVALLHDGPLAAGAHAFRADVPPGVYVVRARSASATATARVTRVR